MKLPFNWALLMMNSFSVMPSESSLPMASSISASTVLCYQGKIRAFVDPAAYFGDSEFEFAFAGEKSSLGKAFFDRYKEIRPFRAGFFEYRQSIYNLYPMLLNVKLFGKECLMRIDAVLSRFGF